MATSSYKEPWGWSKLDLYRTCPLRFKEIYINRKKEPEGPALKRGSEIHRSIEGFLNKWGVLDYNIYKPSPFWLKMLNELKARKPFTETSWGVDSSWRPLKDWFQPETWLRAKSDAWYIDRGILVLIDFKTGKYRIPSTDQIELYAIVGQVFNPLVTHVRTSFWFVDQESAPHEEVFTSDKLINLRGKYTQEALKLYKERKFGPRPGSHCGYCSFSRQKGGSCKY